MAIRTFIACYARTPIGKVLGNLKDLSAVQLGAAAIAELVRRSGIPADAIEEVILGNVISAGLGQCPSRQAALGAGVTPRVGAVTVNKVCGSGLKAVMLADQAIRCGDLGVAIAGGMESMTNAPHLLPRARHGFRMGTVQALDAMIFDGLLDPFLGIHVGALADHVAKKRGISRDDQDRFALESHRKAVCAMKSGYLKSELVAITVPSKKVAPSLVRDDEFPRDDTSLEQLNRLRPAFSPEGTVTPGNAPGISDGAAVLLLLSASKAKELGIRPVAAIVAQAVVGVPPEEVMESPAYAAQKVLQKAGWTADDVSLFEFNEAFAAQTLACLQEFPVSLAKLNVHGGSIAFGHPIGATGARILMTLINALLRRKESRGVASMCLGGGNAVAVAVEAMSELEWPARAEEALT